MFLHFATLKNNSETTSKMQVNDSPKKKNTITNRRILVKNRIIRRYVCQIGTDNGDTRRKRNNENIKTKQNRTIRPRHKKKI